MAAFAYTAINAQGIELAGEIHAPDPDAAREQLRVRGLLASDLEELPSAGEDGVRTVFKKIKPKSLQIFSRQFATMIEAGLNVVSSLVILEEQTEDIYLAAIIKELRADVEGGMLLSQAMARHPKVFTASTSRWSRPARPQESSTSVLDRVAFQIEKETQIKPPRQGRDDLPDDGPDLRDPRPDRDAALPRPGLREDLRAARRPAADADAVRA